MVKMLSYFAALVEMFVGFMWCRISKLAFFGVCDFGLRTLFYFIEIWVWRIWVCIITITT